MEESIISVRSHTSRFSRDTIAEIPVSGLPTRPESSGSLPTDEPW